MENDQTEMSAFQFPNEIWIGIFKYLDVPSLLGTTLVCKHWNHLIFTHLAHRFRLRFDIDRLKYPLSDTEMTKERYYKNLRLRSFKIDSPPHLFNTVKQLAVHLDTLELDQVCVDCRSLRQLLQHCKRLKTLCIKTSYFECDDTMQISTADLPTVRTLSFSVDNYVSTFNALSFKIFLTSMPNIKELRTMLLKTMDLHSILWMSQRLQVLQVTVSCETINEFLKLKLPALQELDLALMQPEASRRKRRIFQTSVFQDFLLRCKFLKKVLLSFRCEYDQQLLTAIFTSLPRVEELQLSGGLATERFSLNGLEKMKHLKTLMLHCLMLYKEDDYVVPMPSVETFSMCTYIKPKRFGDILKRFPNLRSLSFRMHGDELQSVAEVVPLLEELAVDIGRMKPEMIGYFEQLITLKSVDIDTDYIARANFRLLRKVLSLPAIKCLRLCTRSAIPENIARSVAATNEACALFLNGELVKPAVRATRSGVKRKSVNKSTSLTADVGNQTDSGTSASCSALAISLDDSNLSFAMVKCSSPGSDSIADSNRNMGSSSLEESTDGAYASAASSVETRNNSEKNDNSCTGCQDVSPSKLIS